MPYAFVATLRRRMARSSGNNAQYGEEGRRWSWVQQCKWLRTFSSPQRPRQAGQVSKAREVDLISLMHFVSISIYRYRHIDIHYFNAVFPDVDMSISPYRHTGLPHRAIAMPMRFGYLPSPSSCVCAKHIYMLTDYQAIDLYIVGEINISRSTIVPKQMLLSLRVLYIVFLMACRCMHIQIRSR